jgi:hypothetical protein
MGTIQSKSSLLRCWKGDDPKGLMNDTVAPYVALKQNRPSGEGDVNRRERERFIHIDRWMDG